MDNDEERSKNKAPVYEGSNNRVRSVDYTHNARGGNLIYLQTDRTNIIKLYDLQANTLER